jgi:hypothetical protein
MTCRACHLNHSPLIRCEVFARQQAAINRHAINGVAINKGEDHVVKPIDSAGKESGAGRTGNRRSREAYNAYMREYMRKRRGRD